MPPTLVHITAHPEAMASSRERDVPSLPVVGTTAMCLSLCMRRESLLV